MEQHKHTGLLHTICTGADVDTKPRAERAESKRARAECSKQESREQRVALQWLSKYGKHLEMACAV
jgi:hypothetical protein